MTATLRAATTEVGLRPEHAWQPASAMAGISCHLKQFPITPTAHCVPKTLSAIPALHNELEAALRRSEL